MTYCPACGQALNAAARFCRQCGAELAVPDSSSGNHTVTSPDDTRSTISSRPADQAAGLLERWRQITANPELMKAVTKAAGKSLALSAAVLGPGLLLLAVGQVVFGTIWLFAGSFGMVAWTYRKPWRLGLVSCLIPPVAAGLCYLVQLILFANANLPLLLVVGAVLVGCVAGWIRARTHEVYLENGQYFAQRSIGYLAIWAAAFGVTQLLGLLASNLWLIRAGLVTGAFSTAMLALASFVMWQKRAQVLRAASHAVILLGCIVTVVAGGPSAQAQQPSDRATAYDLLADAASRVQHITIQGPLGLTASRPSLREVSRDQAMADFQFDLPLEGGRVFRGRAAVVLQRQPGFTQVGTGDLRHYAPEATATRQIQGVNVLFSGTAADLGGNSHRFQGSAAVARENFKIVCATQSVQKLQSQPGGSIGIGQGMALGLYRGAHGLACGAFVAAIHNQLRLDGSVVSRSPQSPPPVTQPSPTPQITPPATSDASDDASGPSKGDLAAAAAVIATILIAAGIAANIAQSIAIAIASAAQGGADLTADQIQGMIGKGMWDAVTGDRDVATGKPGKPAAPPPDSDINKPPPPSLIDPLTGRLLPTNDKGQYLIGGRWVDLAEARGLVATGKALKGLLAEAGRWISNVGLGDDDTHATADDAGRLWRRVHDIERAARERGHATPGDIGKLNSLIKSLSDRYQKEGDADRKSAEWLRTKVATVEGIFWISAGGTIGYVAGGYVGASRIGAQLTEGGRNAAGGFISGGATSGIQSSTNRGDDVTLGKLRVGDKVVPVKIAVPKVDLRTARDTVTGAIFDGSADYHGSGRGMLGQMAAGGLNAIAEGGQRRVSDGEPVTAETVTQDAMQGMGSKGLQGLLGRFGKGRSSDGIPAAPPRAASRGTSPHQDVDYNVGPGRQTGHVQPTAVSGPGASTHRDVDYNPTRVGARGTSVHRDVDYNVGPGRQTGQAQQAAPSAAPGNDQALSRGDNATSPRTTSPAIDPSPLQRQPDDAYGGEGVPYDQVFRSGSQSSGNVDPSPLQRQPGDAYGAEGVPYDQVFQSGSQSSARIDSAATRQDPGHAYGREGVPYDQVFRSESQSSARIDPAAMRQDPGHAYGREGVPYDDVFRTGEISGERRK